MKEAFTITSISPDMNYAGEDCPATGIRFQLSCRRKVALKLGRLPSNRTRENVDWLQLALAAGLYYLVHEGK